MYYNAEHNALEVMRATKDMFPIKHKCPSCYAEFSFTGLDDFKTDKRDHYKGVYSTIALYSRDVWYTCPACRKGQWLSPKAATSGVDLNYGDNFIALEKKIKSLVIKNEAMKPKSITFRGHMQKTFFSIHPFVYAFAASLIFFLSLWLFG